MNRIDRTIDELQELSSITEIEPRDVAALEGELDQPEPKGDGEIRTLGDFREATKDMRDDRPLRFVAEGDDYLINYLFMNNIRRVVTIELVNVTLEVKR